MLRKIGLPVFTVLITMSLLTSTVFAAEIEITDLISDIIGKITDWLKTSPLTSLISSTAGKTKAVHVIIYPDTFSMTPEKPVNILVNNITFEGFGGTINTSFPYEETVLYDSKTSLKVTLPLTQIDITGLSIKQLSASNMKVNIKPNMTAEDSSVELNSFTGSCSITPEYVEFIGNVTSLKAEIGGLEWELR